MAEPTMAEVMSAVSDLRGEFEKKSPDLEKIDKLQGLLDTQEVKNQSLVEDQQKAVKVSEELKERLDTLELELARSGGPGEGVNYKESAEYKALNQLCKIGDHALLDNEIKALLRTDSDVSGGYLAPTEMDSAITKLIEETSNIRSIARVRTIASKSLQVPVRGTIPSATFEGESEAGADSVSSYKNETLTPYRLTHTVPVTKDMLMDGAFDMESEIMLDSAEAFAKGEGTGFVAGTGHKEPEGFIVNAEVVANVRTSSTSATIDPEDIINITGDLKVGYNPVYVFNRTTLAFIRSLKSSTGQFLWQPGMNGPVANTISGFPYLIAPDMQDIASNSLSIAFGDFRRGYTIIDRTGVSIVRDEVTQKKKAIIEFTIHKWVTGQVTVPEAIKLMKTAA